MIHAKLYNKLETTFRGKISLMESLIKRNCHLEALEVYFDYFMDECPSNLRTRLDFIENKLSEWNRMNACTALRKKASSIETLIHENRHDEALEQFYDCSLPVMCPVGLRKRIQTIEKELMRFETKKTKIQAHPLSLLTDTKPGRTQKVQHATKRSSRACGENIERAYNVACNQPVGDCPIQRTKGTQCVDAEPLNPTEHL